MPPGDTRMGSKERFSMRQRSVLATLVIALVAVSLFASPQVASDEEAIKALVQTA